MSREDDFRAVMEADSTLMTLLTGGVHVSGDLGPEGISRTSVDAAFDANGYLLPCALVRQRAHLPDLQVVDQLEQVVSATQVIEIYLYQDRGYGTINQALARLYTLFFDYQFSDSFPAEWIGTIDRERDQGALDGASLARQDWLITDVIGD